jgi:hypothetical protein
VRFGKGLIAWEKIPVHYGVVYENSGYQPIERCFSKTAPETITFMIKLKKIYSIK